MKIRSVQHNNRRRAFEVRTWRTTFIFPYSKADPAPSRSDPPVATALDAEIGNEGFTYTLHSGKEGTIHIEQVLEYNRDPNYLRDQLLYKLTLEAHERMKTASLSKREVIRRLGTSPAQLYRLLDPTNCRKSVDPMLRLLAVLDAEVEIVVRPARARS